MTQQSNDWGEKNIHQASDVLVNESGRPAAIARVVAVGTRTSAAVIDQVALGGAHFATHILAARFLSTPQYGHFATVYALLVLIQLVQTSLLIEPMLVFGSRLRDGSERRDFVATYLQLTAVFAVAIALFILVGGLIAFELKRSTALTDGGLIVIGVLGLSIFWFTRRIYYLDGRTMAAATNTIVYATLSILSVTLLGKSHALTSSTATAALGISGAISSVPALLRERVIVRPRWSADEATKCYEYAKWSVPGGVLIWGLGNIYYLALPFAVGASGTGVYRAAMNIYLPLQHVLGGVTGVLLPAFSRTYTKSPRQLLTTAVKAGGALVSVALMYAMGLLLAGPRLIHLMYGGKYEFRSAETAYAALVIGPSWAILYAAMSVLRAAERPHLVLACYVVVSLLLATWIVPLTAVRGPIPSIWGFGIVQAGCAFALTFAAWKKAGLAKSTPRCEFDV